VSDSEESAAAPLRAATRPGRLPEGSDSEQEHDPKPVPHGQVLARLTAQGWPRLGAADFKALLRKVSP